jgi:hypothetical protein
MHIDLDAILIDETLYPRNQTYWKHTQQLMGALRTGASLPPIVVGKRNERFVIIDGRHRYEAHKRLKHAKIGALLTKRPESEWFIEAVRLNTRHGHGLSYQERISAAMILKRQEVDPETIAQIVNIPWDTLEKAINQRGTWLKPEDIKPVVAKAPLVEEVKRKGRAWLDKAAEHLETEQQGLSGASFKRLAEELLILINKNHIDADDPAIVQLMSELYNATNNWLTSHGREEAA